MGAPAPHDLVERWIEVWMRARGLSSTMVDSWPLVQVGSPTRETELICLDPGTEAFTALLKRIARDPRAMLTVIAADARPYDVMPLPADIRVDRSDETLMITDLSPIMLRPPGAEFTPRWDVSTHLTTYALERGDRIVALGTIGIHGADATFDAVETMPGFQRRGLGRHVMAALTAYALESGARHGMLAATSQGRLLYETLGWTRAYDMRSLMGVACDTGAAVSSLPVVQRCGAGCPPSSDECGSQTHHARRERG